MTPALVLIALTTEPFPATVENKRGLISSVTDRTTIVVPRLIISVDNTRTRVTSTTRAGGKVCLARMGHHEMTVSLTPTAAREVDVVGVF
ncbi:hypothetical protein L1987_24689 [Smallanthus sonchifolius]|uniref:Uncharacterized protein n=1 Tax=Smallanthus sonchifolius TaxID=185202 RepID=A0ACB9IMW5_9ASTR|nr:hypothetical protein L1987_24689 [Smallanthus sonchifolius]